MNEKTKNALDEIRVAKARMEREIADAMDKFSMQTGMMITTIDFKTVFVDSENSPVGYAVESDVRIY